VSEYVPKAIEEIKAKYAEELSPLKKDLETKRIEFEKLRIKSGINCDLGNQTPIENEDILKIRRLAKDIYKIRTRISKAEKLLEKFEEFASKYGNK
jgi:hypothetical protein